MQGPNVPCNVEAEIALIGCIFVEESIVLQVADMLVPDDFYDAKNKLIFKTIISLAKEGKSVDVTTVVSTLQANQLLQQCGGYEYISSIADYSYSTLNVDAYVDLITASSLKRAAINKLTKLAQDGYDPKFEAYDYVDLVEKEIFELSKRRRVESFRPISEVSNAVLANTEKNATRNDDVIGLDTGFGHLNRYTQGFQDGALIILAARPAMGKSAFALNIATNAAVRAKVPVAIFSLEMSKEQMVNRILCSEAMVDSNKVRTGKLDEQDWGKLASALGPLSEAELYIDDTPGINVMEIRAKCRKLKLEKGLGLVVIDYLQLITASSGKRGGSREQEIAEISRSLKILAKEIDVPVIALSQLSRAPEQRPDHRPMLSDLRESGSIEQDADIVMFLYRDDYYNEDSEKKNVAEVIMAKHRAGSTGTVELLWLGNYTKFVNIDKNR